MGFFSKLFGKKSSPEQSPPAPTTAAAPHAAAVPPAARVPPPVSDHSKPPAAPAAHKVVAPVQPPPKALAPSPAARPAAPAPAPMAPASPAPAPAPPTAAAPAAAAPEALVAQAAGAAKAVPWMTATDLAKKQQTQQTAPAAPGPPVAITGKIEATPTSEFYQGFVKLTVEVKNGMNITASKTQVVLDFNEDVLRLQRIEPPTFRASGSRVLIGDMKPGQASRLIYYLDPQICTESIVDGVVQYKLPDGKTQAMTMKPIKAEVVCPLFFTKEVASSALLKRLVETELQQRDSKVYHPRLEPGTKYEKIYDIARSAVVAHDVREVREFKAYNPYAGECWFYGETKVKGYKIVIRVAVREKVNVIEFFAASTEARAVTGLLAELSHQLSADLETYLPGVKLDQVFDETFKAKVQQQAQIARLAEDVAAGETEI